MTVFNDFEAKLRDNWAVLAVLCFMYLMYMIGLIWARFKDKRDVIKVCMQSQYILLNNILLNI